MPQVPPPLKIVRSKRAKQLADLNEIAEDLERCLQFLDCRTGLSPPHGDGRIAADAEDSDTLAEALVTATVVRYARCFNSGSGRTKLTLEMLVAKGFPERLRGRHGFIMDLRDKYFAHRGHNLNQYQSVWNPETEQLALAKTGMLSISNIPELFELVEAARVALGEDLEERAASLSTWLRENPAATEGEWPVHRPSLAPKGT